MTIASKLRNFLGLGPTKTARDTGRDVALATHRLAQLEELRQKGEAAMDKGYFADAEKWLRQAVSLAADDEKACLFLGIVLAMKDRESEAVEYLERALAANPQSFAASYNLSMANLTLGRFDEAEVRCRQALACEPGNPQALYRLGAILRQQWRIDESLEAFREVTNLLPQALPARTGLLWMHQYVDSYSQAEIFEAHRRFGDEIAKAVPIRKDAYAKRLSASPGQRRLKVGYVSADFRDHAVALFMLPLLEHHDKSQFEVFAYHTAAERDHLTSKIAAAAEHFVESAMLTNSELVERIIADEIDVLVDLGGHTNGNRLEVFAERPAPVQMSWLGYVDTTGMTTMDYRLTCVDADPPENDAFHSETLYRLQSHLHFVFRPKGLLPPLTGLPALERGYVTFLSNNQMEKITPKMISAWAAVLRRVPGARMVIMAVSGEYSRNKIIAAFASAGIEADRLTFHGRFATDEFYRVVMGCDLCLDTYPFNGGTTTCENLCLGVPVITLKGRRFASRVGLAILKPIGLERLVASSFEDYVEIAVREAQDIQGLAALRADIRSRVAASPLRDESGFTRCLEDAYREMVAAAFAGAQREAAALSGPCSAPKATATSP